MRLLAFLFLLLLPLAALAQDQDPLLEITFEERETIPGQPLTLRLTVFVPTFMPKPPIWPSFETPNLRIRLPERSTSPTSRTINGDTWSGISRRYQVTPVVPGTFTLPPSVLQVTFTDPEGGPERAADLPIDEMDVTGLLPKGAEDLSPFIAANSLSLSQKVEGTTEDMDAGQSFTRTLTAEVEGVSPYFLPTLTPDTALDGLRAYPETPAIDERDNRGLLSGSRSEKTTYLAETALAGELPDVSVAWFNLKSGKIETATVAAIPVSSKAAPPPPNEPFDWRQFLPTIAGLLIFGVGIWIWRRWCARPFANWRAARHAAHLASESYAFRQLQSACKARNLDAARSAYDIWSQRMPNTTADSEAVTQAFLAIGRARFGDGAAHDDGQHWATLSAALVKARQTRRTMQASPAPLPPLNP